VNKQAFTTLEYQHLLELIKRNAQTEAGQRRVETLAPIDNVDALRRGDGMECSATQLRIVVLGDAWDLLKFLNDSEYKLDEKAAGKELRSDAAPVLDAAIAALEEVGEWTTAKIEIALKVALLENLALKPRKAFGPIRVAATGASISPPLFESLELLGRDRSLRRLRAGRDHATAAAAAEA